MDLKTSMRQPEDSSVVVYSMVDKDKLVSETKEISDHSPQKESGKPIVYISS